MNRRPLSSTWTFGYKFIAFPILVLFLLVLFVLILEDIGYINAGVVAFMFLIVLLVFYFLIYRIYFIEYDDQYVYVKRFFEERKIELYRVKSVNEPYAFRLDPTFELEILPIQGSDEKFDFLIDPAESLEYVWSEEMPQSITGFLYLVKQVKETQRIIEQTT